MRRLNCAWGWAAIAFVAMLFATTVRADDAFTGGWSVHCTPNSATATLGADPFDDGFLFENDNFSAQAYAGLGFTPAAYTVDTTGKFTATLVSSDRGTVVWKGRLNAGSIYGWITWTKPDGSVFKYTYTGNTAVADSSAGD